MIRRGEIPFSFLTTVLYKYTKLICTKYSMSAFKQHLRTMELSRTGDCMNIIRFLLVCVGTLLAFAGIDFFWTFMGAITATLALLCKPQPKVNAAKALYHATERATERRKAVKTNYDPPV